MRKVNDADQPVNPRSLVGVCADRCYGRMPLNNIPKARERKNADKLVNLRILIRSCDHRCVCSIYPECRAFHACSVACVLDLRKLRDFEKYTPRYLKLSTISSKFPSM